MKFSKFLSMHQQPFVSNASFTNPATTELYIEPTAGIGESLDGDEVALSTSNYNTATMAPGEIYKVYLVVDHDVTSSANNGDTEDYFLIANATVSETGGSDTADSEDVVYADNSGPALEGDTGLSGSAPDGKHSDSGRYVFRTVVLSMQKTETLSFDPYGLDFHLPGVYVQYNVVISNTTGTDPSPAFLTELNDTIGGSGYTFSNLVNPTTGADLGYAFDITVNGSSRTIDGIPQQRSSAVDTDNAEEDGSGNITLYFDSATMTAAGGGKTAGNEILPTDVANGYASGELRNGESITIKYNVLIDGALDNDPVNP